MHRSVDGRKRPNGNLLFPQLVSVLFGPLLFMVKPFRFFLSFVQSCDVKHEKFGCIIAINNYNYKQVEKQQVCVNYERFYSHVTKL